jgi:hypothetical protein
MLRVEASNLPKPRGTPRARRLLPTPPVPRRAQVPRHELLPPPNDANPPATELALPAPPAAATARERWSVRLELGDDEIAKLYGQGMTRGAVVWKKGMVEWRPLLITAELSGLLHRTRIMLSDAPALILPPVEVASATATDELTLPRPARLPSYSSAELPEKPAIPTLAPLAADVEPPPVKRRRPVELLAVAVAAFTLAWIGHAKLHPQQSANATAAAAPLATPAAPGPACEPAHASTLLASSSIPTIAVSDLPLVGAASAVSGTRNNAPSHVASSHTGSRSTSANSGGPSRSDLVAALSQVARASGSCGERGGPVRVVVSFTNSGVARSIQVSGADLPAATRSCIIGAASRARVGAFTGDLVTVAKTL